MRSLLAASVILLVSVSTAWSVCCPKLEFDEGVEDMAGLVRSCGDIATSATKVILPNLSIYKISADEYVFVHDVMGCIKTVFRAEDLFLSNDNNDVARRVLLTSSNTANISISWDHNDLVFYYSAIRNEASD